ncbi:MAG TPA: hypothetical protein DCE18_01475 [Syntrophobacteraceae bacterium]|nr:hypothetical protein [Syntrophobacteraceae bacterium]
MRYVWVTGMLALAVLAGFGRTNILLDNDILGLQPVCKWRLGFPVEHRLEHLLFSLHVAVLHPGCRSLDIGSMIITSRPG